MTDVTLDQLNELENQGLVRSQVHPSFPLTIWNYAEKVQFESLWTPVLAQCRGLILNTAGQIVARPFPKFFNLNQVEETKIENLPAEIPTITEKLDGSLGIVYWYGEKWNVATRGSFTSEQAQWAQAWLDKQDTSFMLPEFTYLFEIIYEQNRIVVDYAWEGMVLLAAIRTETGFEKDHFDEAALIGFPAAKLVNSTIEELTAACSYLPAEQEGFVLRYSNGLRVKMKGDEYCRLHRLLTQCTARRIWECLSKGESLDAFLEKVPDEFYQWVKTIETKLKQEFDDLNYASRIACISVTNSPDLITRKDQALYVKEHLKEVAPLVFTLLDGKPIDEMIWKRIRPEHEVPFKVERGGGDE